MIARIITAIAVVAILVGSAGVIVGRSNIHVLAIHDTHFTGAIVGNSDHAVVVGHGVVDGFVFDTNAELQ